MDGAHANAYETDANEDLNFWTPEESENLKKPMLVPAKLVAPTVVREWDTRKEKKSLSKKAEADLQRAKDLFDNYLANAEYAPPLAELLRPSVLDAYKEVAGEGFSLYSIRRPDKKEDPEHPRGFTHDFWENSTSRKKITTISLTSTLPSMQVSCSLSMSACGPAALPCGEETPAKRRPAVGSSPMLIGLLVASLTTSQLLML